MEDEREITLVIPKDSLLELEIACEIANMKIDDFIAEALYEKIEDIKDAIAIDEAEKTLDGILSGEIKNTLWDSAKSEIMISEPALAFLKNAPEGDKEEIIKVIEKLKDNPRPVGSRKVRRKNIYNGLTDELERVEETE